MVPYIAALIILITAILFAVYKRVDTFEVKSGKNFKELYDALCNTSNVKGTSLNPGQVSSLLSAGASKNPPEVSPSRTTDISETLLPVSSSTTKAAEAPVVSSTFSKEVEDRITKSIEKQLKDSLLAKRSTENVLPEANCPYASSVSNATAQGQEYVQGTRSPQPDMSEYIRKDSITCWNCSLP